MRKILEVVVIGLLVITGLTILLILPAITHSSWKTVEVREGQTLNIRRNCSPTAMVVEAIAVVKEENIVVARVDGQRFNFYGGKDEGRPGCPMIHFAGVKSGDGDTMGVFWVPQDAWTSLSPP